MKKTKKTNAAKTANTDSTAKIVKAKNTTESQNTVEVLYQKMGEKWFAFSVIEDEVFVGSISPNELSDEGGKGPKIGNT